MQAPDHQSLQPSSLRLERHEITDAGFVVTSQTVTVKKPKLTVKPAKAKKKKRKHR